MVEQAFPPHYAEDPPWADLAVLVSQKCLTYQEQNLTLALSVKRRGSCEKSLHSLHG
jgi:hypothetical protein